MANGLQQRPITINLVDGAGHRRKDTRTIKKQVRAIVEQVQKEEWKLTRQKPLGIIVREQLINMIGRIDPLDTAAVLGMAVLVKGTIDASEELLAAQAKLLLPLALVSPLFLPVITVPLTALELSGRSLKDIPDWQEWIVSFAIAYMLVKHGDAILATFGSLFNFIKVFLAAA